MVACQSKKELAQTPQERRNMVLERNRGECLNSKAEDEEQGVHEDPGETKETECFCA